MPMSANTPTDPSLPPEVRFLAEQAGDPVQAQRIVRAYYAFANGSPESASVQFALVASALLKANITLQQKSEKALRTVRALSMLSAGLAALAAGISLILLFK